MSAKVLNAELAIGVHPSLVALLEAWEQHGTHDVMVAHGVGFPAGGLRTDVLAQHKAFVDGLTKARTLADTPHGRGAAIDIWPVGFNPHRDFSTQPGMEDLFRDFGEFAEGMGFRWGGRFGGFGQHGDMPHVEILNWHSLPYPPAAP